MGYNKQSRTHFNNEMRIGGNGLKNNWNKKNEFVNANGKSKAPVEIAYDLISAVDNGVMSGALRDIIKSMDATTKQTVFIVLDKIAGNAQKEINENGGIWQGAASSVLGACNLLFSIKMNLEQQKRQGDNGITL